MFAAVTRIGRASLAAALLALPAGQAAALSSDKDQPIEVEADYAELDDSIGETVYRGSVVIVQGSMRLTGDQLTVFYAEDRKLKRALMVGQPARFKQRPDRAQVDDEGEALRIEYFAQDELLVLQDKARFTQGERSFSGAEITYDTTRSLIKAYGSGQAATGGKPAGDGGRVRIVLPPPGKAEP
jgi:lipopolysaccharide export system protein LptA